MPDRSLWRVTKNYKDMKPSILDELKEKENGKDIIRPDLEPIPAEKVNLVLTFYSSQQKNEDIEESFNYIIDASRCCNSLDEKPQIQYFDKCCSIGLSTSLFNENRNHSVLGRFILSIANMMRTNVFCFTVKSNGTYIHKVFKKEDFSFFMPNVDPETQSEKRKCIGKVYEKVIGAAKESISIADNSAELNYLNFKSFHYCGGLIIRNIDCEKEPTSDDMQYASDITEKLMNEINKLNIKLSVTSGNLYQMALGPVCNPEIPIIMKKEMPDYEKLWENIDKRYIPKGKVLGYYTREDEDVCRGPHIVIGADEIANAAKDLLSFKVLFAKVLVHELAHAIMDKYLEKQDANNKNSLWPYCTEAKAMEESLANMITLQCFYQFAHNDYPYVLNYIDQKQPAIYQFGIWQEKIDADWKKWCDNSKGYTNEIKEWFNNCFVDGYIRIPKEYYTKEMFDKAII